MVEKKTLFSIIVPIYNVELYLAKCIDSVLSQSYSDWELILVDDGSKDNCALVCDSYARKDARIKVIHKKNGGLVSARKSGSLIASGNYTICLDGDDFLHPECLSSIVKIIKEFSPEIVCFGHFEAYGDSYVPKPIHFNQGVYLRKDIEEKIAPILLYNERDIRFPYCIWGKCYKTDMYKSVQLSVPDNISIGEDLMVTCPLIYKADSLFVMGECLYYYRYNLYSMTKCRKSFDLDSYKYRFDHLIKHCLINPDIQQQIYNSTTHGLFNACVSQFYPGGSFFSIRKIICKCLSLDIYQLCIKHAKYKTLSRRVMLFIMRHRICSLMWLYSKF